MYKEKLTCKQQHQVKKKVQKWF